jgi:hypothetical protein
MLEANDVGHVLVVKFAQWRRGLTVHPGQRQATSIE